jgi:putative membrane protein
MYGSYNHGWMSDGGVGMLFGALWMILFLVVPLLLLAVLLKYLFTKSRGSEDRQGEPAMQTPLDVLKAAYARGEINREEYLQKRDDLLDK